MSVDRHIARLKAASPSYPPTPHWDGGVVSGTSSTIWMATEKLDGANAALFLDGGQVVVRNRTHILRKGYHKDTPAKAQFAPLFTWAHQHKKRLLDLERLLGGRVSVYGEWCWAVHGVLYPRLPEPFIAWAVRWLDAPDHLGFIDPFVAREALQQVGFSQAALIGQGAFDPEWLTSRTTAFGDELLEGVVLTRGDGRYRTQVLKWIRPGYAQNYRWSDDALGRQGRL